jgi:hypothetical protein
MNQVDFFFPNERQLYFTQPNPSRIGLLKKLRIKGLCSPSFNLCNIVVIGYPPQNLILNLSWIHNEPLLLLVIIFLQQKVQ